MNRLVCAMLPVCFLLWPGCCQATEPGLTLSIAIPQAHHGYASMRSWKKRGRSAHFQVVLRNETPNPIVIRQDSSVLGYKALRFEATDEHGKLLSLDRAMPVSNSKTPATSSIKPMEDFVIDVSLNDRTLSTDRFLLGSGHRVTLEAIYEAYPDDLTRKLHVWTGRITSEPVVCIIY